MKVRNAHDLPDFRLWLIDQWRPGGVFSNVAAAHVDVGNIGMYRDVPIVRLDPSPPRYSLPRAALWYVSPDMSRLVDHASRTLPETTLTHDLMPDEHGLVVFAEPLRGTTADTHEPINIRAIGWCFGALRAPAGTWIEGLAINTYQWLSLAEYAKRDAITVDPALAGAQVGDEIVTSDGRPGVVAGAIDASSEFWMPCGMSDWQLGKNTEAFLGGFEDSPIQHAAADSDREDRCWLAALWLLASQPLAHTQTQNARRQVRRRTERANIPATSDVRLIDVRRQASRAESEHEPGEGGTRRGYSHRFIVGGDGGFWRQQACGPGWKDHRPVWIAPFVKGPADKPLRLKETVKVLKEDP